MEETAKKITILEQKADEGTLDLDKAIDFCLADEDHGKGMCMFFIYEGGHKFTIFDPTEDTRNRVHVIEDGEMSFYVDIDLGSGTRLRSPVDHISASPYCMCGDDDEDEDFYQESDEDED